MAIISISNEEVEEVIDNLKEIIQSPDSYGSKLRIEPRNDSYDKIYKTIDKYGFGSNDILKIFSELKPENYHNTIETSDGLKLHSFIYHLEEDLYIKFRFKIIDKDGREIIMLISFHPK
jgi:hypothetical protein